jgi:hypothetical protein
MTEIYPGANQDEKDGYIHDTVPAHRSVSSKTVNMRMLREFGMTPGGGLRDACLWATQEIERLTQAELNLHQAGTETSELYLQAKSELEKWVQAFEGRADWPIYSTRRCLAGETNSPQSGK